MAQHRASKGKSKRHVLRYVLLSTGLFLALMYWHGHNLRTEAMSVCMPDVAPYATGHMHFNPCATLDTSQVQDRCTPAPTPGVTSKSTLDEPGTP
jgi:hypothetical protein